ncbi:hypothetical protein [Winogradskyella costae]|uniref:hypothetical protein n=1 Tax=Winogradskyella costae TaxID=2697008 RepID=UPI0015C7862B|nr:hypothetical protein [Winogradskyella costae]
MNKLDFSISLRERGLDSKDIKKEMKERGFDDSEIQYYLKKSDEIFLNQSYHYDRYKSKGKTNGTLKMFTLIISLALLTGVFLGYATIGLIGLFIMWSLIGYGSFKD